MTHHTSLSRHLPAGAIAALLALFSIALLGGCTDAATVAGPADTPPAEARSTKLKGGPTAASVAIEDAITRLLPALPASSSTAALEAGLVQIQAQLNGGGGAGLGRALSEVLKALDKYQQAAGDEFQPDIDAIQLALLGVENTKSGDSSLTTTAESPSGYDLSPME